LSRVRITAVEHPDLVLVGGVGDDVHVVPRPGVVTDLAETFTGIV